MRQGAKTGLARHLRKAMTDAETCLWCHLRSRQLLGLRFRKQHPIGPYVADFACVEARLIVELDGSQHLDSPRDSVRDAYLRECGFRVLRIWNDDALLRTEQVLTAILDALSSDVP